MQIHYFQRYHSKENVETANAMLMLSRLYHHDVDVFYKFLSNLVKTDSDDVENPEIKFELQRVGTKSVPDAIISQKSFKVIVETKLLNDFNIDQLLGHINEFKKEDIKILLTLGSYPMIPAFRNGFGTLLQKLNKENNTNIKHVNLTFAQLIDKIESVIDENDSEIYEVFEDFKQYCLDEGLTPQDRKFMRAVASWQSYDDNRRLNLIYERSYLNISPHGFIGLYKNKSVRAIGKLEKIVTVAWLSENNIEVKSAKDAKGNKTELTGDESFRILEAINSNPALKEQDHTYFLVDKFVDTNFYKSTKHPLMKAKFFNLAKLLDTNKLPKTAEIAEFLNNKSWEQFIGE